MSFVNIHIIDLSGAHDLTLSLVLQLCLNSSQSYFSSSPVLVVGVLGAVLRVPGRIKCDKIDVQICQGHLPSHSQLGEQFLHNFLKIFMMLRTRILPLVVLFFKVLSDFSKPTSILSALLNIQVDHAHIAYIYYFYCPR